MTDNAPDISLGLEHSDLQAEQAVLGAMIMSASAISDCADILRAGDFCRPAHQEVFATICQMDAESVPVDAITLRERLDAAHVKYGGALYLHDLLAAVPSAANAAWYAARVRDLASRRALLAAGRHIIMIASNSELDAAGRADRAGRAVDAADALDAAAGSTPVGELLPGFLEALEAGEDVPAVRTGTADMDRLLSGGLRPGELVTFGARPGVGKSVFLLGAAVQAAVRDNKPVVFWSLEMSRAEILQRIIANLAAIPLNRLREHALGDDEWDRIRKVYRAITDAPLHIDDRPYLKLPDLRGELRRMRHRGKPAALAVLDYLQLMTAEHKSENRQTEVAELARGLKLMAKEFEIPIIAASQLNRASEARSDKRPMLADLRESGAVEQDSDIVVLGYREDLYEPESPRRGEIDLIVAKHRGGATGTITAAFQGHYSRIVDMAGNR
jgi:replicative DNA helicase